MLIVEETTVTMKWRTAIQPMLFYFIVCLSVMLTVSHVHLHSYHFLLIKAKLILLKTNINFNSVVNATIIKTSFTMNNTEH